MSLMTLPAAELLARFRSSDPTPGGGSASALTGALGASLLTMVASLPKPRAATEDDLARLHHAAEECRRVAGELERLVDRDSDAYDLVMAAYRLPKGTDEEKTARAARIQEALRVAIDAPLDVMRACAAAAGHAGTVAALANANASSDVGVARELLRAGFAGAKLNVEINLGSVKDAAYAEGVRQEMSRLEAATVSG